jgi:hypothetical protein
MSRGEQIVDMDEKHYQKINQVIQVRPQVLLHPVWNPVLMNPRTFSPKQPSLLFLLESLYLKPLLGMANFDTTNGYVMTTKHLHGRD